MPDPLRVPTISSVWLRHAILNSTIRHHRPVIAADWTHAGNADLRKILFWCRMAVTGADDVVGTPHGSTVWRTITPDLVSDQPAEGAWHLSVPVARWL